MVAVTAVPLEKHSSLHKIALTKFFPGMSAAFNFNILKQSLKQKIQAQLIFQLRDSDIPADPQENDFCITNLRRWRLDVSTYHTFDEFLQKMKPKLYKRYEETQKLFQAYGATLSVIEGDWSQYAETVYKLYLNVAKKNGAQLYDLNFFRLMAEQKDYPLMCIWYKGDLVSAIVMVDEAPIIHSAICALDYEHSKNTRAYTQLHYQIIRLGIESKKYSIVDVGITADKPKSLMSYRPVSSCMDVSSRSFLIKRFLRFLSRFASATINAQNKLEWSFHLSRSK